MRLHSPQFERALVREVKSRIRSDRQLRKEYRIANRGRRRRHKAVAAMLGVFAILFLVTVPMSTRRIEIEILAINILALTGAAALAHRFSRLSFYSYDIVALLFLGVEDEVIFQWEYGKLLFLVLFRLLDFAVAFAALGLMYGFTYFQWGLSLGLLPIAWMFTVALAALASTRLSLRYELIVGCMTILMGGVLVAGKKFPEVTYPWLGWVAPQLNAILPTGWVISLIHVIAQDEGIRAGFLFVPVLAVVATYGESVRLMRERFVFTEAVKPQAPDLIPGKEVEKEAQPKKNTETGESVEEEVDELPPLRERVGVTEIEDGILSGEYLRRFDWESGLEGVARRWFTERQRNVAELAYPVAPQLLQRWKNVAIHFLIASIFALLVNIHSEFGFLVFVGGAFVFVEVFSLFCNHGVMFVAVKNGNAHIPFFSAYPIMIRDMFVMMIKLSLVQMPFLLVVCIFSAAVCLVIAGVSPFLGIPLGIKACALLFGARVISFAFHLLKCLTSGSRPRLTGILTVAFIAVYILPTIVLGLTALFMDEIVYSLPLTLLTVIMCYVFCCIWRFLYRLGHLDLIHVGKF